MSTHYFITIYKINTGHCAKQMAGKIDVQKTANRQFCGSLRATELVKRSEVDSYRPLSSYLKGVKILDARCLPDAHDATSRSAPDVRCRGCALRESCCQP